MELKEDKTASVGGWMDRGYRGGNFDRVVRRVCDGDADTGERSINGTGVVAERKGSDEPPESYRVIRPKRYDIIVFEKKREITI